MTTYHHPVSLPTYATITSKVAMKQRTHVSLKSHRLLFALASLLCWQEHLANAASATAPSLAASSTASSPASTSTSNERHRNQILSFFHKFESHGPTLTLTLRNPSRTTLLGGGGGGADKSSNAWSKLWAPSGRGRDTVDASPKPPPMVASDDGTFGLSSKLGALFHISSSSSTTNNGQTTSSSPTSTTSQFADGYMLDDGEIFLDPPSAASGSSSSSRGLFSIREMGSGILSGGWGSSKSWSECAQNVHPELRYEMKTKEQHSSSNDDGGDTRPFPATIPWLSGISCGMIWTPFPTYKPGYPEGYGHKLMSVPHYIRCGARLSLPRFSTTVRNFRFTSRGISNSFTMENNDGSSSNNNRSTKKDLDLGVTYRDSLYRPDSGTLELLVGRSSPSLPPPKSNEIDNRQSLLPSDKYRRRNHLLVRLATGHKGKPTDSTPSNQKSILSSIEYAKGSFRMPTPFFLRNNNNNTNGGISVSPSFDFVEGTARCVFSGDVGSSGRTRAVLRLDVEDSTLTLVRALDDSKIIAPTISLNSGKIVYDYYLNLDGQHESHDRKANSSIRAHVDPTKGILLKWTDGIRGGTRSGSGGGSCWVTECRIPLGTTAAGPLAADVRVGRRWVI
mmetsp:Transcript_40588/g.71371  ORF Transcript_40588/g.71371 Transcript_40588/m.71371 type:complete len:620 (-) Transcript_40588:227-2086(-)